VNDPIASVAPAAFLCANEPVPSALLPLTLSSPVAMTSTVSPFEDARVTFFAGCVERLLTPIEPAA
jgi:hypothetical protein